MPFEVEMPKLGLTMEEGTVADWLKAQGDEVERGEPLFLLETDKITLEAEAPESGILGQILVEAGTTVPTGTPVALILQAGEEIVIPPESVPEPQEKAAAALGETPTSGPEAETRAKVRATPVARRQAEKAGLDLGAIAGSGPSGRVTSKDVEAVVAKAQAPTAAPPVAPADLPAPRALPGSPVQPGATAQPAAPAQAGTTTHRQAKASPRAQELAQEAGLDLVAVRGTGRDGRVMTGDVERALAEAAATTGLDTQPAVLTQEVTPLTGMRGVIARRMSASAHTAAAVTTTTQADATELVRLRDDLRQEWTASLGIAPSYNDLLLVILAKVLAEFPYVNSHIVDDEIRQQTGIHIGLAVDTDRGLIVPVMRGLQGMLLADVARSSRDLVQRAREGKLLPDDVSGGTFTLSNMGGYDVEAFTPILNLPEVAILGLGRIAERPAAYQGQLALRQTVMLSLTYDHRAIDGAPAARFLERVKQLVERPYLALVR